jgi:hypothetical protein
MEIPPKHPLNTNWLIWYHNPKDTSWDISSYKDIIEVGTLEEFVVLDNSWTACLPDISEGMFFMMRRISPTEIIYPQWEDIHNRNGGYWSFRIAKEDAWRIWSGISALMVGETLCKNMSIINGMSISPKKSYCILRVWNNDKSISDTSLFTKDIGEFVNMGEAIFTCNDNNIDKYNFKTQKKGYSGEEGHRGRRYENNYDNTVRRRY